MGDNIKRITRRRFLRSTGAAAGALALAGCTQSEGEPRSTSESETTGETTTESDTGEEPGGTSAPEDNTLYLTIGKVDTLDPVQSLQANSYQVRNQMNDGLVIDRNGELEMEGLLATDYEISEDGRTYTFTLKEGVKYHDGTEVTAHDFVYVFERVANSPNSSWTYFIFDQLQIEHETVTEDGEETYKPGSLATKAVDDYTFEFTLEGPYYATMGIIGYYTFAAIPEGLVDDVEGYDGELSQSEFANNPVGCGPFEFSAFEPGSEIEVARFDEYHGTTASVEGVHWQVITDPTAEFNYSMNMNSDIITIPTSQYDAGKISIDRTDDMGRQIGTYGTVRNGETVNYMSVTGMSPTYLVFNVPKVPKVVRQAFAYVTNQALINEQAYKNRSAAAPHMMPPNVYPGGADAADEHANQYPYGLTETRIEKAKEMMEEAGYGSDNVYEMRLDGWETDAAELFGNLLRDQLTAAHIDLEVQISPASSYWERASNGNFDVYLSGWGMTASDPGGLLTVMYPPNTDINGDTAVEYATWLDTPASEEAAEAWETVKANAQPNEEDKAVRSDAFIRMEEANWEDVAFLPLIHNKVEQFSYDWVDLPLLGPVGEAFYRFNHVSLSERGK